MPLPASAHAGRLRIHRLTAAAADDFAEDVRRGLSSRPKRLPPKYFYDALGSQLFDAICLLPEYYLTRAEADIFERHGGEIVEEARRGGRRVTLFELGSGSASKTRHIIEALLSGQRGLKYVPVDISPAALEASAGALLGDYESLSVAAYAADYDAALPRLRAEVEDGSRALVLFLGSNVGNFGRGEARELLRGVRASLRAGDVLLLGADLKKEAAVLEAAYDDELGVTAAFNLNLLARVNRELGADFSLRDFRHVALYDEREGRVEMHLESLREQTVRVAALGLEAAFAAGERLHTESSHKYSPDELSALAAAAGFSLARAWLDAGGRFSSNLFVAEGDDSR